MSLAELASQQLTLRANAEKAICHRIAPVGELRASVEEVVTGLTGLGFRVLRWDEVDGNATLVHEVGFVGVNAESTFDAPVDALTIDERLAAELRERISEWVEIVDGPSADGEDSRIFMLHAIGRDLEFHAVGRGGKALRRENYGRDVLKAFDHVVADIDAVDPCGRMVLFTGPPGTGKTHLVRGILAAARRPRFILVQPGEIRGFLDASPLTALASFIHGEAKRRSIVLVIEDADVCLLPRGTDNLCLIGALLNLTDGLVGAAFDIRLVATTNAKHIEIDPALLRPGRICRRIDVPLLKPDHATGLLAEMTGRAAERFRGSISVAEVYAAARDHQQAKGT